MSCGQAARQQRMAPKNLRAKPSAQSASVRARKSPRRVAPALFTSTSIRPRRPRSRRPRRRALPDRAGRRREPDTPSARGGHLIEFFAGTRHQHDAHPFVRQGLRDARPIPWLAPVTIATLPASCRSIGFAAFFNDARLTNEQARRTFERPWAECDPDPIPASGDRRGASCCQTLG